MVCINRIKKLLAEPTVTMFFVGGSLDGQARGMSQAQAAKTIPIQLQHEGSDYRMDKATGRAIVYVDVAVFG